MKCFLSEPEALADFLRRGSANASGSKSQAKFSMKSCVVVIREKCLFLGFG